MFGLSFLDVLLVLVLFVIAAVIYYYVNRPRNLPPGPFGVPFLGAAPFIKASEAFFTLTEWKKRYGPLMSFYMGDRLVVVLADTNTIQEALIKQGDIFSGRPRFNIIPNFLRIRKKNNVGIISADGAIWKEQRRFALSTLRDFGFGRPLMENKIREEIDYVLEEIQSTNGQLFDPQKLLNNSVSNVICSLVFGSRFDYNDKQFQEMLDDLNFLISASGGNVLSPHNYFTVMLLFTNFFQIRTSFKKLFQFIDSRMIEHKKTFNPNDEPNNYIDAYMKAQKEGGGASMDDTNLQSSIFNLFGAGTETTATTLRWAMMFMGLMPKVQEKVYEEMVSQLGEGNIPSWSDRPKLPYTEAVLMEIQRMSNLAPMALAHRTTADTTLMGYTIPKDAIVIPLLWAVHRDSSTFEEAYKFRPERFLEEDGKTHRKYDGFMPFSAGKRICLGESLAKMELFLFFTAIVARYRLHFDGIGRPDPYKIYAGVTITPKPFKIIAEPRSQSNG